MRTIVSVAMSLDGFIADDSTSRLVLSSPQDLDAVYRLRAASDAILVGGETLRSDNPSLATRHAACFELRKQRGVPPHPMKATITGSGNLPADAKFFQDGDGQKLVFCGASADPSLEQRLGSLATVVRLAEQDVAAEAVVANLARRGVSQLIVEGGARTIGLFFRAGVVDVLRLAVAPVICGKRGRSRPFTEPVSQWAERRHVRLEKTETLGDTAVMWYQLERTDGQAG
jgi:riboflavin-specific deaminase-like protein